MCTICFHLLPVYVKKEVTVVLNPSLSAPTNQFHVFHHFCFILCNSLCHLVVSIFCGLLMPQVLSQLWWRDELSVGKVQALICVQMNELCRGVFVGSVHSLYTVEKPSLAAFTVHSSADPTQGKQWADLIVAFHPIVSGSSTSSSFLISASSSDPHSGENSYILSRCQNTKSKYKVM